ncbi:DUF6134 family protein [Hymenobacter nivis]|uniref:DUF6134 family protein n=1 Tax=Hymenobacter nivis TaxID=1850093 RepID=UPI001FE3D783|nr:DUF6134 family protein [Hymenobacter nivis]
MKLLKVNYYMLNELLFLSALPLLAALGPRAAAAQGPKAAAAEVRRYSIEVAGVRVGTMTATRQAPVGPDVTYALVSDVRVNFLFYRLKIYYRVTNHFRSGQLLLSTVEAHTNQGDFSSRAEWKGDHYDIVADQYKHHYRATETQPIRYAVTNMFFGEPPAGQARAFAEYFGDYFALSRGQNGAWQALRAGREDEYQYTNGQLVTLTKKNPLKNFIIRLLP